MPLLAYNLTTSSVALAAGSPIVTLPASSAAGVLSAPFDVTSELRSLSSAGQFALIAAQMTAAGVPALRFEWTGLPEYKTYSLTVGSAADEFANADVDVYVDSVGGDDNNPGTVGSKVATLLQARKLLASTHRKRSRIRLAAGSYVVPSVVNGLGGSPDGSEGSPETWIGTRIDSGLGALTIASATTQHFTQAEASTFRTGSAASITAFSGTGQTGLMTVTGMSGLTSADVGKNFFFGLCTNAGNNGTFKLLTLISATSAQFVNAHGVVENTSLIYWQDSFRGATLRFTKPGRITCVAVASLVNNDNFTINRNGVSKVFEYKVTGGYVAVAGRVTIDVSALGDTSSTGVAVATATAVTAADFYLVTSPAAAIISVSGLNTDVVFTIAEAVANAGFTIYSPIPILRARIAGHGAVAKGSLTCPAKALLVDGDNFFVPDGTGVGVTFEYQVTGGFVAVGGRVAINVTASTTAAEVAAATRTAINTVAPTTLRIRATNTAGSAVVKLKNMIPGVSGNQTITEAVADAGFTVISFTGGVGTPLTTYSLSPNALLATAPSVTDPFVVEKPGTILIYTGIATLAGSGALVSRLDGDGTELGVIDCKLQASATNMNLSASGLTIHPMGLEVDSLGNQFSFFEYSTFGWGGLSWISDPTNPFFLGSAQDGSVYMHHGNLSLGGSHIDAGILNLMMDHSQINCQVGATMNATKMDFFRSRITIQHNSLYGSVNNLVADGNFELADLGILLVNSGSVAMVTNAVIENGLSSAINVMDGSSLSATTVSGDGNAKVGIRIDNGSKAKIDNALTTVSGTLGDLEFGHESPTPNYRSYAAARVADAAGVKGFRDDYGNQIDV